MKIRLKRTWFGPGGYRLRKDIVHEVPNEWKPQLPEGAVIVDETPPAEPVKKK